VVEGIPRGRGEGWVVGWGKRMAIGLVSDGSWKCRFRVLERFEKSFQLEKFRI